MEIKNLFKMKLFVLELNFNRIREKRKFFDGRMKAYFLDFELLKIQSFNATIKANISLKSKNKNYIKFYKRYTINLRKSYCQNHSGVQH